MGIYYTSPGTRCNHQCLTHARRAKHEVLSHGEVLSAELVRTTQTPLTHPALSVRLSLSTQHSALLYLPRFSRVYHLSEGLPLTSSPLILLRI